MVFIIIIIIYFKFVPRRQTNVPKKHKSLSLGLGFQFFEYLDFGFGFRYFENLLQISN